MKDNIPDDAEEYLLPSDPRRPGPQQHTYTSSVTFNHMFDTPDEEAGERTAHDELVASGEALHTLVTDRLQIQGWAISWFLMWVLSGALLTYVTIFTDGIGRWVVSGLTFAIITQLTITALRRFKDALSEEYDAWVRLKKAIQNSHKEDT